MYRALTTLSGPMGQTGMVGLWGAASIVKSLQSGYLSGSTEGTYTATINTVIPENCLLLWQGFNQSGNPQPVYWGGMLQLTNATTVSLVRRAAAGSIMGIQWTVLEFLPGIVKSIQQGVIDFAGVATNTATITSVTPEKCALFFEGYSSADATGNTNAWAHRLELTNATTITAKFAVGTTASVPWRLVEFY